MEVSAKTAENVELAFLQTATRICENVETGVCEIGDGENGVRLGKEVLNRNQGTEDNRSCYC